MTDQELLGAFTGILRDILLDDTIVLTKETRREDVPNWDSFNYINFIVAVEVKFGVKFKVADIESFENIGAIIAETQEATAVARMPAITLASRTFDSDGQVLFASLTGDFNPIHLDPIAARRTQAGTVVVHGIHAILWALDKLVEIGTITEQICSLKVQFTNFIRVGSQLDLKVLGRDGKSIQAELSVGRLRAATLIVTFGARQRIKEIEVPDLAPKMSPAGSASTF